MEHSTAPSRPQPAVKDAAWSALPEQQRAAEAPPGQDDQHMDHWYRAQSVRYLLVQGSPHAAPRLTAIGAFAAAISRGFISFHRCSYVPDLPISQYLIHQHYMVRPLPMIFYRAERADNVVSYFYVSWRHLFSAGAARVVVEQD